MTDLEEENAALRLEIKVYRCIMQGAEEADRAEQQALQARIRELEQQLAEREAECRVLAKYRGMGSKWQ